MPGGKAALNPCFFVSQAPLHDAVQQRAPLDVVQVSTRILGRRTAPFFPISYFQPRPAWVHPKILVLTTLCSPGRGAAGARGERSRRKGATGGRPLAAAPRRAVQRAAGSWDAQNKGGLVF